MKHYKVIKENFLWEVGAILEPTSNCSEYKGYEPIDEVYKKHDGGEYISKNIVENSPDYFQRVYKVDLLTRTVYETKEKAKELLEKAFKSE